MLLAPRYLPRLAATVGLFTRYGLRDFAAQQGLDTLEQEPEPGEVDGGSAEKAHALRERLCCRRSTSKNSKSCRTTSPRFRPPT
jgi:hypothetical protein